ncbi:MAG: YebC/PmpR family DNA-binding transcriptional regulator [Candidatus Izemoplasmatales bacterium]|nr:YebC/PmpR family DNA-binding transcriptional regulator [bacterium]MDZ4197632.1 YebC/PmpR family DNA-binding transcriptional regulator [Candidatus Izemoplasmatales bacterium]
MGRAHEVRKVAMMKTSLMKSKIYSRFGKEIYMAAKTGGLEPDTNLALKKIIEKAKAAQVPGDVIKRNIDKAKGGGGEDFFPVRYEGFGPGGSTLIVEAMTDNVNRTFGEVRACFTKIGAKLGVTGSVIHQYQYVSMIVFEGWSEDEALEAIMEAECEVNDISTEDGLVTIIGPSSQLDQIKEALLAKNPELEVLIEKVTYLPNEYVTLDESDIQKFHRFIAMTDELDDVQEVFHNIQLPIIEE